MISQTRTSLNKLEVGMTRQEVVAIMGEPRSREAIGNTEFLLYRTEAPKAVDIYGVMGVQSDRELTPVAIVNGRVSGWGRNYYDNAIRTQVNADVTVRSR